MADKVIGKVYLSQEQIDGLFSVIRECMIQDMLNQIPEFPIEDISQKNIDYETL